MEDKKGLFLVPHTKDIALSIKLIGVISNVLRVRFVSTLLCNCMCIYVYIRYYAPHPMVRSIIPGIDRNGYPSIGLYIVTRYY